MSCWSSFGLPDTERDEGAAIHPDPCQDTEEQAMEMEEFMRNCASLELKTPTREDDMESDEQAAMTPGHGPNSQAPMFEPEMDEQIMEMEEYLRNCARLAPPQVIATHKDDTEINECPAIQKIEQDVEGQDMEMEEFYRSCARLEYEPITFTAEDFAILESPESPNSKRQRNTELKIYHQHLGTKRYMTDSEEELHRKSQELTEMLQQETTIGPNPALISDTTRRWVTGYSDDRDTQQPDKSSIKKKNTQLPREVTYVRGRPREFEEVFREIAVHIVVDTVGDPILRSVLSKCPCSHEDQLLRKRMRKAVMLAKKPSLFAKDTCLKSHVKPVMAAYTEHRRKWDHKFEASLQDCLSKFIKRLAKEYGWTVVGLIFHHIQLLTLEIMKSNQAYDFKEFLYTSVVDACYWAFKSNRTLVSRYLPCWTEYDDLWNDELE